MKLWMIEEERKRGPNYVSRLLLGLARNKERIGLFVDIEFCSCRKTCLSALLFKVSNHLCDIRCVNPRSDEVIKLSHVYAPLHFVNLT